MLLTQDSLRPRWGFHPGAKTKHVKGAGHFYVELGGPEENCTNRRGTHTHSAPEILISEDHKLYQQTWYPSWCQLSPLA